MSNPLFFLLIKKLNVHNDHRGYVVEPLDSENIAGQRNAHLVVTRPGEIRGNHYHNRGTETITIIGPALIRIRDKNMLKDISIPECREEVLKSALSCLSGTEQKSGFSLEHGPQCNRSMMHVGCVFS